MGLVAVVAILATGTAAAQPAPPSLRPSRVEWSTVLEEPDARGLALAVTPEGDPVASFVDHRGRVVVTRCSGDGCEASSRRIIGSGPATATAIAIGVDGNPLVAYVRYREEASQPCSVCGTWWLRLARCLDRSCDEFVRSTFWRYAWDGTLAYHPAIDVARNGNPVVTVEEHWNLRLFSCRDPACAAPPYHRYLNRGGEQDVVVRADGAPLLAFHSSGTDSYQGVTHPRGVVAIACDTAACSSHQVYQVDEEGWFGRGAAAVLDADDLPFIAYLCEASGLKVARCEDPACADASTTVVDPLGWAAPGSPRPDTAIIVGPAGYPVVAYVIGPAAAARVVACASPGCDETGAPLTISAPVRELDLAAGGSTTAYLLYQELVREGTRLVLARLHLATALVPAGIG